MRRNNYSCRLFYFHAQMCLFREMWHGRRWRDDPLYQAPMVEIEMCQVFVADFISVVHPQNPNLGAVIAKVLRLYMKVSSVN